MLYYILGYFDSKVKTKIGSSLIYRNITQKRRLKHQISINSIKKPKLFLKLYHDKKMLKCNLM